MQERVLIIDDDLELCALLGEYLQLQGFAVAAIHDGSEAIQHLKNTRYDVLVLDIMLPGTMGLDVLRTLRQFDKTPVLMLTARGEDTDRIVGLELGADDYLPKPCNPRELAARLRAILRRVQSSGSGAAAVELEVGATRLNSASRTASHRGQELGLTSAEFNILQVLMQHAGKVVDKDILSRKALDRPLSAYDRSIDVHISKVRRKLAAAGGDDIILSVRGRGYQFVADRTA
ncbi:response regulator transcription factor [Seongchinamella unica]|uniref:Response regulator transcription factor n=1 Tax=Seongchinamella unica TaxID=2547392 RepID=A0A4R5LT85_9GAMM|nr:response regulator transcription factor [Seongchinamella unica]TDG14158.1 response regulator transcription factor [Seongchinamella unica]